MTLLPRAGEGVFSRPRRRAFLTSGGLLLLFLALFLVPLPAFLKRHGWLDIPFNLTHVVLLGGLAWVVWRRGPLKGRPELAAAVAFGVGLGIEMVQSVTGRQMSVVDLTMDASGAGLVVCWARRGAWRAPGRALATALCLAFPLWHASALPRLLIAEHLAEQRFPLLADFETRFEGANWRPNRDALLRIVPRADGGHALAITGVPPQVYPGANLNGFPRDWTRLTRLEWDARVVGADSLRFIVRLDDFEARRDDAWLASRFTAGRAWQHFVWEPTGSFGRKPSRPQRRDDMDGLTVYLARPAVPVTLEIDNLRLR